MSHQFKALILISLNLCLLAPECYAEKRPNVLFIAVDDLRPELGCYGCSHIHSPNIDALARSGRLFDRAYCQQAVCNPSRTSLMTGMRPDSIGVTGNHAHFRSRHPDVVTLPQHFKNHGYHAAAIGKIYHGVFPDGASITKWDTMGDSKSWSTPAIRFGPRYYYTEEGITAAKLIYEKVYKPTNPGPDDWTKKLVFGPATESPDVPDSTLYDGQVADSAVKTLRELKGNEKPFFLAVGFIKPHSPYIAPKKYFDLYRDVKLASHPAFPADAPSFASHDSGELRRYTDQPSSGIIPKEKQRRIRHAYFACISYIDAQIGRVLKELNRLGLRDKTIVVLFGDHGYHLGEQGLWGKTTNFELDTRVPLIVRAPGMKMAGRSSASLVEFVDLYPSLTKLAGLPMPKHLEGTSFASILDDPEETTKSVALSQYPRAGNLMGYSMRTATHRLTQWVHRPTGEVRATELYDYREGIVETKNIASSSSQLVKKLTPQLQKVFPIEQVPPNVDHGVGFENVQPGPFVKLTTKLGTWQREAGSVIIDDKHAKTGKHCLQLMGGKKTALTLRLADDLQTTGALTFWAERWTRRLPFSFRIEKKTAKGWSEIYDGDTKVRVGRAFLSHVKVPLGDKRISELRFSVTSPPKTGILIDDIRLAPARKQKIADVKVEPLTLPALVGTEASPLLKLVIDTTGSLDPISLSQVKATLEGTTDIDDFESVSLYLGGASNRFSDAKRITGLAVKSDTKGLVFDCPNDRCRLIEGRNFLWIAVTFAKTANIDQRVGSACLAVSFSNGKTIELKSAPSIQRMGVAVRKGGDDGVHTFRIPGLVTTNKGTLIGVYDVRRRGGGDLPGDIDVGMSRSTDGGRTWQPMKVIMDMGDDPKWRYDGIGDPAILVDRKTGTIWVAATWSHGNRSWFGSGPGLKPTETGQLMLARSDDDGKTWSKPINITAQVKKPEWCFLLQGPGKGITMRDGTLVFAAQYQDPPEKNRLPHSTILYSTDHGKTWKIGTGAFDDTTEAQVVEPEPGVLMLNCRYNRQSARVVMTTKDMGKTWQVHPTSRRSLIEPRACMASLIDVDQETGKELGGWLLFSNPDSTKARDHITIKASNDRGKTWPKAHRLLIDEGRGAGYSCLTMIDEKTVGILYEGSQAQMTFQRIPLSELVAKENQPPKPKAPSKSQQSLMLPRVFGHHMVLQADCPIPIWGRAKPGVRVSVSLGDEKQTALENKEGHWQVRLRDRKPNSTPMELLIESAGEQVRFRDVLMGEVWVCAGQSNMEWPLDQTVNGERELAAADENRLRLLHLKGGERGNSGSYGPEHLARLTAERFCEGRWEVASAKAARSFSAVAWYFGRQLQRELDVPVGLICPAVGGTPTEAWILREALAADPNLRGLVSGNWLDNKRLGEFCRTRGEQNLLGAMQSGETIPGDVFGPNHSFKPGFMWSAGIEPLIPYAIRGAIWYQGESNAETRERTRDHSRLFSMLVNQWRKQWGQGDFPFLYVQLPSLNREEWPLFREGQRRLLEQIDNLGMAITIDTGHRSNVHPRLKKPVGERLARWALGTPYRSKKFTTISGPLFDRVTRKGDHIVVSFDHVGHGLKSVDECPLRHFEIAGEDGVFHPASAKITARGEITLSSPRVTKPVHARYAWIPFPDPPVNLVNSEGLPASPFSTESEKELYAVSKKNTTKKETDSRPNILLLLAELNARRGGLRDLIRSVVLSKPFLSN